MTIADILSRKLHETFGDEAAGTMIDWMQSVNTHRSELRELSDLAFDRFDARLGERLSTFRQEFRDELRAEGGEIRMGMHAQIVELRREMDAQGVEIRREMNAQSVEIRRGMNDQGAEIRREMNAQGAAIRSEMNAQGAEIRSEMQALGAGIRTEMNARFDVLGGKIDVLGERLETRYADLMKWSFAFWIGSTVTLMLGMAAILRIGR